MIFATIFIILCMIFIAFLGGMIVGAWIFSFENPEQEPCASCEYTEGSEWCIKHCPHDIEYGKMKTGHWIPIQEIVGVDKEGNEMSAIIGYMCSECGERHQVKSYYCRYCGARMIESEE